MPYEQHRRHDDYDGPDRRPPDPKFVVVEERIAANRELADQVHRTLLEAIEGLSKRIDALEGERTWLMRLALGVVVVAVLSLVVKSGGMTP